MNYHIYLSFYQWLFGSENVTRRRLIFNDQMRRGESNPALRTVDDESFRRCEIGESVNGNHVVERSKVVAFVQLLVLGDEEHTKVLRPQSKLLGMKFFV